MLVVQLVGIWKMVVVVVIELWYCWTCGAAGGDIAGSVGGGDGVSNDGYHAASCDVARVLAATWLLLEMTILVLMLLVVLLVAALL